MRVFLIVAALVVLPLSQLGAQQPPPPQVTRPPGTDEEVVMLLHRDSRNAIALGDLARRKGVAQPVRDYGTLVMRDFESLDARLATYARTRRVDPRRMQAPYQAWDPTSAELDQLRALQGPAFDREFLTTMISRNQSFIERARSAQLLTHDQALKDILGEALPAMRTELATGQSLAAPARR
jgi:putative membrane protein